MFTTQCFIRKNTEELQSKLKDLDYDVCICCNFNGAVWLHNLPKTSSIHGIGYPCEDFPCKPTQEDMLAFYLYEAKETNIIDCGENEELFLALVALQDNTDKNQWFTNATCSDWYLCHQDKFQIELQQNFKKFDLTNLYHKATKDELIKHFTKKV